MSATSREKVFAAIRSRMPKTDRAEREAAVTERLAHPHANLIPTRGQGDDHHRITVFSKYMEDVGGTVEVLDDINDVPQAVAHYLRQHNLPAAIRHGADPALATLPWHRAAQLEVEEGRAKDSDKASLSMAFAGAAESGTVILVSGADNPTTLNFLPEAHIVVMKIGDLHASYEEAWVKLRQVYGPGNMPRTVNMISGPSRTADIEQTIVRPAHGPKDMHVIIIR